MEKRSQDEPVYENSEMNMFLTRIYKSRLDFYSINYISVENFNSKDKITYIINDKKNTFYQPHSDYFHNFVGDKYDDNKLTYPLNDDLIILNNESNVIWSSSSQIENLKKMISSMHLADAIINAVEGDINR